MFPYTLPSHSSRWQPGPYSGVDIQLLRRDDSTGGIVVLRRFKSGITVPAHTHPLAAESVYVLSGEWEEDGQVYGPGTFFHVPRGILHGPHIARGDVISLTIFDGPLTVA